MSNDEIVMGLLETSFSPVRCSTMVKHFSASQVELSQQGWANAIVATGRFVEAVLKGLLELCGLPVPEDRKFSAGHAIDELGRIDATTAPENIRLTVPRACRFVYDVASNRGSRHDSSTIDPSYMDAQAVCSQCAWILAELVRYASGTIRPDAALRMIQRLTMIRFPLLEEVDGRLYVHIEGLGARQLALIVLAHHYPNRLSAKELIRTLERHEESSANARIAVSRLKKATPKLVDDDGNDQLLLLAPGLKEAEDLLSRQIP